MKKSTPSKWLYILAYLALLCGWLKNTFPGKIVTAAILVLFVSVTFNSLSAAPFTFLADDLTGQTAAAKAEVAAKAETSQKAEAQKKAVEEARTIAQSARSHNYSLTVTKSAYRVTLLDNGIPVKEYNCAVGRNPGQKTKTGDAKTPEGTFKVESITASSDWVSSEDGKGAYGPWFITLDTGELSKGEWGGIGLSGTNKPEALGKASSTGSIRLRNDDIEEIKKYVQIGTPVTIKE